MNDRRLNWKKEVASNTITKMAQRQTLMTRLDEIREKLRNMTIEERRSDAYDKLMSERVSINAQLGSI